MLVLGISGLPQRRLRTRLTHGVAWHFTGVVFNQGSTFLVNVILAHVLGLSVFGQYAIVQSTVQVAALLAQVATGYTATKYIAEFRSTDRERAGRMLGLLGLTSLCTATLTAAILLGAARWIAHNVLDEPRLAAALGVASAAVFFSAASGFLMGSLAGLERYKTLGLSGVASGIVYVVACLFGAAAGGVTGAVVGVAASGLFQTVVLWWAVRTEAAGQGIVPRAAATKPDRDVIFKFAVPAALNGFIAMPAIWITNAMLARQPGGFALMALFSAATSFRIIVLFLPNIVNGVSMSLLNHQKGLRDVDRYRRMFWVNLFATLSIVTGGAVAVSLAGRWLLTWFGPGFRDAYGVLLVLMAVTIPESASTALYQVIQSRERMWWSVGAVAIPCFGTLVLAAWRLVPDHGALGLAWAYLAGWTVALIANSILVYWIGVTLPEPAATPVGA